MSVAFSRFGEELECGSAYLEGETLRFGGRLVADHLIRQEVLDDAGSSSSYAAVAKWRSDASPKPDGDCMYQCPRLMNAPVCLGSLRRRRHPA